jgi:ADP-dependent NAD(P)H-hydrate dehydratase
MIAALNSLPPDLRTLAQQLLQRPRDCHKYDFGRVVVVGGSRSMAGAPALAGMAALRAGAGVVEVAVPVSIAPVVAGFDPALIVHGLPEDDQGGMGTASLAALQDVMQRADVLVGCRWIECLGGTTASAVAGTGGSTGVDATLW